MDTLERNYAELDSQRKRDLGTLQDEAKQLSTQNTKLHKERDESVLARQSVELKAADLAKHLQDKQAQYDSLSKDFAKT